MNDVHEELNRLILRRRWIAWCDREWKRCDPRKSRRTQRRLLKLAGRLSTWKPTWEQRNYCKKKFDGAVP